MLSKFLLNLHGFEFGLLNHRSLFTNTILLVTFFNMWHHNTLQIENNDGDIDIMDLNWCKHHYCYFWIFVGQYA